ncbi:MAG: hydroxymethylbilane synthase [Paludibacteraceae bacterium]|nr:hydroxymethylbilane synthase [Paludibacteraceae bacterium]
MNRSKEMSNRKLRVVARSSQLSLLQVEEVFSLMDGLEYELVTCESYGDRHKEQSLTGGIPSDFFTRELDAAVLEGKADIAIHSAKDLPFPLPKGLEIYALTDAFDKSDSLVSRDHLTLAQLPSGARIATSSVMRKKELLRLREDLRVVDVRGTIGERIAQLDRGDFEGLIVASCALHRLGLSDRIAEPLPFETHPLQGHIAIVGRTGDETIQHIFSPDKLHRSGDHQTQAYYLRGEQIPDRISRLMGMGIDMQTPVLLICNLGGEKEKGFFFHLNELQHTRILSSSPILMLVGERVSPKTQARSVLVTGSTTQWAEGRGTVTHTPLIRTERLPIGESFTLQGGKAFDYILFTSRNGVRYFTEQLSADDLSLLKEAKVISVGQATTRSLNDLGITPVYESESASAKGIVAYFERNGLSGKRILLPRSAIGIAALPLELRRLGNEVTDLPIYKTETDPESEVVKDLSVYNEILFSSPSGVRAFMERYGGLPNDVPLTSIGETTAKEILASIQ